MAFSQSIVWETRFDFGLLEGRYPSMDEFVDLSILDTSTFFSNCRTIKYSVVYSGTNYKPVVLKHNNRGEVIDSFVYFDTVNSYQFTIDRSKRRLWMVYQKIGRRQRLVLQKINAQGQIIQYNALVLGGQANADSIPRDIYKLLPSTDGGFYIIATAPRVIASQNVTLWQVSRWDSLGVRRWVREYRDNFVYGAPNNAEILPNGELMVSGWKGTEVIALHIDTGNGAQISRKVLFINPRGVGWNETFVRKLPDGYLVTGNDLGNPAQGIIMKLNDSLTRVWGSYPSTLIGQNIQIMADSSFWMLYPRGNNFFYDHFSKDSVVLNSLTLTNYRPNTSIETYLSKVEYFANGDAIIGGDKEYLDGTERNKDIVLIKVANFGTPYNPVYPPVGPVPVANKKRIVEPDLQVFPNPFTHTLRISHKGTMQLLDIHGRKVMAQAVEAGQEINTGALPRGMYLLRFTSSAGKGYVRKVVRE